ncbi:MAG TPA: hypothetical protein VKO45_02270 [Methanomicrobiales archaeon]|nr:hypothetical protein [Methanomicrobiales archaeon]
MQIPPSSREEVMKAIPLRTLLSELEKRQFTGYCAMPIAGAGALLVMEEGRYILAEYRGIRGRDALESIRLIGNPLVDVILAPLPRNTLTEMRGTNEPFLVDPPRPAGAPGAKNQPSPTVIRPVSIGGGTGRSVKVVTVKTGRREEARQPAGGQRAPAPAGRPGAAKGPTGASLDRKGLEHLKSMKDSFKNDAADLLSELNLEHLVSKRSKSGQGNEGEGKENSGTG